MQILLIAVILSLISPPIAEAIVETLKAFVAIPFFTNGKPSIQVAADAGVPGVFNNIAEIDPPYIAPIYIPTSIIKPVTGSIPKVNGNNIATPIVAVNPGSAPIIIPPTTPIIK